MIELGLFLAAQSGERLIPRQLPQNVHRPGIVSAVFIVDREAGIVLEEDVRCLRGIAVRFT